LEALGPNITPVETAVPIPRKPRKGKWRRRIGRSLGVLIGIPLFLVFLLQFSYPQTFVASYALDWLSAKLDFKVQARRLHLNLIYGQLTLDDVQIIDRQGKTMIAVEQLKVDFDYRTAFNKGDILLKEVLLKRGAINLIVDKKTQILNITEFIERIGKLTERKEPRKDTTPSIFAIKKARLEDVFFSYHDNKKPYSTDEGMDYSHFGLDHIHVTLNNFRSVADTMEMQLKGLRATEHKTQLEIKDFTTRYRLTRKTMDFGNLHLAFGNSVLRKNLTMRFVSQGDLSDFVEKVTIVADLDSTVLDTRDLTIFAPTLKKYKDVWQIKGLFEGAINHFSLKNLHLGWGKGSTWQGNASLRGLPAIDSTYMNLDFQEAKLVSRDLLQYVNQQDANDILEKLGEVAIFKGLYKGYVSDFEAGGSFQTALGEFETQMRLAIGDGKRAPYYKVKLTTPDLQIGKLLGLEDLKNVSIDGEVEGTGFTQETAHLKLDTKIKFADFNDYRYQDIEIKGNIGRQLFEGICISKDPNFDFDLNGTIDFNPARKEKGFPPGRFLLKSDVRNIDLQALNFLPTKTTLKGNMEMDLYGLHIDSLSGSASLKNIDLEYLGEKLHTAYFDLLTSKNPDGERLFVINADYINLDIAGKFYLSDVMHDLPTLAQEYWLSLQNKKSKIEAYYKKKEKLARRDYNLEFNVILNDINPLLAFFDNKLVIAKNSSIQGEFIQQRTSRLNLSTTSPIDSVFYGKNKIYGLNVDLTSSKLAQNSEVLANLILTSTSQHLGTMDFDSTSIDATWDKRGIEFETKIHQTDSPNRAKLFGMLHLQDDTTIINFNNPSNLQFYNDHWNFDKDNEINMNPLGVVFDRFILSNKRTVNSQIGIQGTISDSIHTPLEITLKQIDLGSFAQVFKTDINGSLNGNFTIANLFHKPDIQGELAVENLMYKQMLIGDVDGKIKWIDDRERLAIDLTGFRKNRYILSLMGSYYPNKPDKALDLEMKFNRTDLEIFEPFADEFVSKVGGNALGKILIKGRLDAPEVSGKVHIANGRFKFNMLNTDYDIDGDIVLKQNEIITQDMVLYDEFSNNATLQASLHHTNFQNFYVQTDARLYNFQVLNTVATPNSLYYGTAIASGKASIRGFLNNLTLVVEAKTQKGTKLFLPLDGYQEVGAKDYIRFVTVNKKDSAATRKINLGGMKLKFNLDINPNAEFEIIIDSRTGDMITAKGRGNIEMDIDTKGDFNIHGKYTIQQGKYNFTFANFVNKGFNIDPNSSIQFNGDMYSSQLDVRAVYDRHIPLRPLIDIEKVTDPTNPEYKRPYSVKAILDMKGSLFNPEIKLGLDLTEAKRTQNLNLKTALLQLESLIINDEQERNKQVFSLLILGQLSQANSFNVTGQAASSSLSEMISNQFSNWISQVDENLDLSFNVSDVANPGSYQLRMSYNFLDGRLRITREGGFTNSQNQADVSNIVGDWTLEYLLSSNGRYRLKTYRRNNTAVAGNTSTNLNAANAASVGFSFMHTAGFNRLIELIAPKRNRTNAETGTGGIRTDNDADIVIFNDKKDEPTITFLKTKGENAEIEEEKLFPLKRRTDTLKIIHTPTVNPKTTEKIKTPDIEPTEEPIVEKNKNTKVLETGYVVYNKEITGDFPLPHRFNKGVLLTNNKEIPKENTIVIKKNANTFPLPHRFGR